MAFLVATTAHLSGDLDNEVHWWARLLCGAAVILLLGLLHVTEMIRLFGFLVGSIATDGFVSSSRFLAWPWLAEALTAVCCGWRWHRFAAMKIASSSFLVTVAPLLFSFVVFFVLRIALVTCCVPSIILVCRNANCC